MPWSDISPTNPVLQQLPPVQSTDYLQQHSIMLPEGLSAQSSLDWLIGTGDGLNGGQQNDRYTPDTFFWQT